MLKISEPKISICIGSICQEKFTFSLKFLEKRSTKPIYHGCARNMSRFDHFLNQVVFL